MLEYFRSDEFQQKVRDANIIFGVDEPTGNKFLAFGRSSLEAIVSTGRTLECAIIEMPLFQETDELEAFLAAVVVVKGYHEYQASRPLGQWPVN
jgi:hypothetical protein